MRRREVVTMARTRLLVVCRKRVLAGTMGIER